jgi:hypothetical protein
MNFQKRFVCVPPPRVSNTAATKIIYRRFPNRPRGKNNPFDSFSYCITLVVKGDIRRRRNFGAGSEAKRDFHTERCMEKVLEFLTEEVKVPSQNN